MAWGKTSSTQLLKRRVCVMARDQISKLTGKSYCWWDLNTPLFSLNFWDCHNAERLGNWDFIWFSEPYEVFYLLYVPSFLPSLPLFLPSFHTLISFLPVLCLRFLRSISSRLELWTVLSPTTTCCKETKICSEVKSSMKKPKFSGLTRECGLT